MLEKVENRGSFVFRGCERHDTGWPKSFAKGRPVYVQSFGRALRSKPKAQEVETGWKLPEYETVKGWIPGAVAIPDCRDTSAPPAWFVPEELPYPAGAYKAENHSLGDGTLEGVDSEVWTVPDFDDPGKEWVLDRKARTVTRRAASHSLNDGNRDRKRGNAWRDFRISVKRFADSVACETASFFEAYHVVIAWFFSCAALAMFAVVAAGAAP